MHYTQVPVDPVFINRELTTLEQVNWSIELFANDKSNTWIKTGEFIIKIPSFLDQVPTNSTQQ